MPTFTFYGTKAEIPSDSYLQLKSVQPNVQATEFVALSVRSGDSKAETIETADDDLVVMQLSNDVEWHYRADDFEAFLKTKPGTNRGGKKGELEVHLDAEKHLILADEVHFTNLISNLLDNAVKYSKDNLCIKMSTQTAGNHLKIKIEDNGIGMNKETLNKIFEKFYRAHINS